MGGPHLTSPHLTPPHLTSPQEFQWKLSRTLSSLLQHSTSPTLHLVLVTDAATLATLAALLLNFLTNHLSSSVILNKKKFFPAIHHSFVDIQDIIKVNQGLFATLKELSITRGSGEGQKYAADLFYIGPLYHQVEAVVPSLPQAFTSLTRIIFIDSTDIQFFGDVRELEDEVGGRGWEEGVGGGVAWWVQFGRLPPGAVVGIGRDMSPHYRSILQR